MKNLLKKILYIILILLSGCAGSAGYRKMSDLTAAEITKGIRIGWNLGNSFDAEGGETGWGNPPVTEELIQTVSGLGFGAVRIPVTWSLHFGPEPDYLIDPEWIIRVEEVVRYVIDNGMYAIINMHHDGADGYEAVEWITLNDNDGAVTEENNKKVMDQFTKIWTQIAEHFRNYNEKLIFESMN